MMKNTPKKKRIVLDTEPDQGLLLFGLVCSEPDYKLSLELNRTLRITLKNTAPLCISEKSDNTLEFSKFTCAQPSDDKVYDLISNRSGKSYLLKKLKNIDYILQVHSHEHTSDGSGLLSVLRNIKTVSAAFMIDTDTINDSNLQHIMR